MSGLCQTTLRRARGRAGLSEPLYPPRCHLERPPDQRRCPDRGLPTEGLSHQIRRTPKDHVACHARVHSAVPDPCATRRLPSHPALRPAGQRDAQGQHQNDPRPAMCRAPGPGPRVRTQRRDHPAYPARTMPLLRWPHAHHRSLPSRANTNVARTTTGAYRQGCLLEFCSTHVCKILRIISGRVGMSSSPLRSSSSCAIISRGNLSVTASVSVRGRPIFFIFTS